ncbi:MAG: photosystem I reaction center subunit IV [Gammaproteobacteria bacterium]|nr:photosystem I reaction center subunit IV [Gammaproteobacteria bacterium]
MANVNSKTALIANRLILFLSIALSLSITARAEIDYLETPAFLSEKASKGLLLDIVNTGKHLVAVGERGHIIYSADHGKNWQQASVPVYATLTAVFFISPDVGWVVGHEGVILHSTDAGKTWTRQLDGYQINKQVITQAQQRVHNKRNQLETVTDKDQREEITYQLEEAGYALEEAIEDEQAGPFKPLLDVWFADEYQGYALGAYGILLQTLDGGENWTLISNRLENPEGFHLNSIAPTPSGTIFITGESGTIFRSTNEGENWIRLNSPYEGSFFGITSKGNSILVFGLRGNIYRSRDNGNSWKNVNTNAMSAISAGMPTRSGLIVLVGNAGHVLFSKDQGKSFNVTVRPDRLSLSAITESTDHHLIAVGSRGVHKLELP